MNQEYMLLGGLFWRILGKRAYLWRNYHQGNVLTWIAMLLANGAFCTSRSSYTARFRKTTLMPIGVNTAAFSRAIPAPHGSILSLGRITPDKRLDVLVYALDILQKKGINFRANIYGNPSEGSAYGETVHGWIMQRDLGNRVALHAGVPNYETPILYATHEVFVNTSPSGMYDKTLVEAAAAGCLVLTSIEDFKDAAGEEFWFDGTAEGLAAGIESLLSASAQQKDAWRARLQEVAKRHSLDALVGRLATEIQ
jgi:glycosyltransferase involved in cell wall biosynthesis